MTIFNSYHFKNGIYVIPALRWFGYAPVDPSLTNTIYRSTIEVPDGSILLNKAKTKLVEKRKEEIGNKKIKSLALVPTTECYGRCSYCYAKNSRTNPSSYITTETIENSLSKIDHDLERVIIYGGDPVVNPEKLNEVLTYFKDIDNVCIVTGLLYDNDIFNNLIDMLNSHFNSALCVSIDPITDDYSRKLTGIDDVYSMLLDRVKTLTEKVGNEKIGYRITVTEESVKNIKELIEYLISLHDNIEKTQITIEFAHSPSNYIPVECANFLFEIVTRLHNKYNYPFISPIKRYVYNPIDNPKAYHRVTGDCGQLFSEITIDKDGNIHGCNESPTNDTGLMIPDWPRISDEVFDRRTDIKDQCKNCDFIFLCGGFCFKHVNNDVECEWRMLAIIEALYWSVGRAKKDCIEEIIKLNNE